MPDSLRIVPELSIVLSSLPAAKNVTPSSIHSRPSLSNIAVPLKNIELLAGSITTVPSLTSVASSSSGLDPPKVNVPVLRLRPRRSPEMTVVDVACVISALPIRSPTTLVVPSRYDGPLTVSASAPTTFKVSVISAIRFTSWTEVVDTVTAAAGRLMQALVDAVGTPFDQLAGSSQLPLVSTAQLVSHGSVGSKGSVPSAISRTSSMPSLSSSGSHASPAPSPSLSS